MDSERRGLDASVTAVRRLRDPGFPGRFPWGANLENRKAGRSKECPFLIVFDDLRLDILPICGSAVPPEEDELNGSFETSEEKYVQSDVDRGIAA